jgi:beta-N-acetylhexosaminidase
VDQLPQLAASVLLPGFSGTTSVPRWLRRRISEGLTGVVLFGRNVTDDAQVAHLTELLRAERPDIVVGIDEEGGDVTRLDMSTGSRYPGNYALGAVGDVRLTADIAAAMGARLAACGVTVDLAPCADLSLELADPVIGVRSFGPDPARAAEHMRAFVSGLQSNGIAACAKHFPGHGASTVDSHHGLPVLDRTPQQLDAMELVPFQAAIAAGVRSIMTGHLVVPVWSQEPATLSRYVTTQVLRERLGFTGTVITDALDMGAVADTVGTPEAAVRALIAGADALCVGGEPTPEEEFDTLVEVISGAVTSGRLPEQRLAEAAEATARLSGPVPAPRARLDSSLGLFAARKAVRAHTLRPLPVPPLVVDIAVVPNIAVGDVPWGLGSHLANLVPGVSTLHVESTSTSGASAAEILNTASHRPLVLVTRDAHRYPTVAALVVKLCSVRPDTVHVETGVPGPGLGAGARIDTYGGSMVCLRAAAELIAANIADTRKATLHA